MVSVQLGCLGQKHLASLLAELGLFPSLIEPTLYKGYWRDVLILCLVYVDDILLATGSREASQKFLDFLKDRLKVKTDRQARRRWKDILPWERDP